MSKTVILEKRDGVAVVTISRPEALNALNSTVIAELEQVVTELEQDRGICAMILTGEGRSFVAGADIAEQYPLDLDGGRRWGQRGSALMRRIEKLEFPTIAAVNGFALGGASLPVDGIREIEIEWIAGEVEIECYDGSEIVFSETSAEQLSERQTMRYLVKDGELEIRCCESKTVQLPEKTLTVQIPASLIADELEADVVSASLTARGVQAREIKLESVSGNICADGLTAEKLQIDTVSGIAEILRCDVARKLKIDTVSGNAAMQLAASATGFTLKFDTVSGSVHCDVPVTTSRKSMVYGDGSLEIEMESVSGSFKIS